MISAEAYRAQIAREDEERAEAAGSRAAELYIAETSNPFDVVRDSSLFRRGNADGWRGGAKKKRR